MRPEQYIKILNKKENQQVNHWVRLARENGRMNGYLRGGRMIAQIVGVSINDKDVILAAEKAHSSEGMASRVANKTTKTLRFLIRAKLRKG